MLTMAPCSSRGYIAEPKEISFEALLRGQQHQHQHHV
jgi:hypothetical protein